jgi:hypothetical protein
LEVIYEMIVNRMASNQSNTFAITPGSTATLSKAFFSPGLDRQFFFPSLRGLAPGTRRYWITINPQASSSFGGTSSWFLDNSGSFIDEVYVKLELSAITQTGGTTVAYRNDVSGFVQLCQINQAGTLLYLVQDDMFPFRNQVLMDVSEREAKYVTEQLDVPFAQRAANAVNPQTFFLEIPLPCSQRAIPIALLSAPIQLQITWKPLLRVIQYDGTAPVATINSQNLRVSYIICNERVMGALLELSKKNDVMWPFIDLNFLTLPIPIGASNFDLLLSQFRSLCANMGFWIREARQLQDTTGNFNFEWTNSWGFNSWNITSNGLYIKSSPLNMDATLNLFVEIPDEYDSFIPATWFGVRYPQLSPFGVNEQSNRERHEEPPINFGNFNWSLSASSNFLNLHGILPDANQLVVSAYSFNFNSYLLSNGSLLREII